MSIVRAKEAFAYFGRDRVSRIVKPGDLFDDSDEAVQGREKLFEPVEVTAARRAGVETATAEPGELRSIGKRPRKTTAPAPAQPGDGDGGTGA
ncbi:putative head-to-tail connector protein [Mycobacterium phage HC]|uniref:Putative head-to-tail connector protein n=1 Tax=Mycobacterium phage HC TaxID=2077135 RepID=A0A2Z5XVK2_9CAUD|nr:head-tail connector protein [Mycobacterium phage HC]BBC53882.1 putative head-to-tail connector protein [Mycobacterium phage HC]